MPGAATEPVKAWARKQSALLHWLLEVWYEKAMELQETRGQVKERGEDLRELSQN